MKPLKRQRSFIMPVMPLAQRGISTNRLVLGCMSFGGGWNRDPLTNADVLKAEQAVDAALSIGISMFDHADIYGMGKAETAFGQILKGRSSNLTKRCLCFAH